MTKKQQQSTGMNASERKAVFSLAGIYALRMMGLFMILPVFSMFAHDLPDATPWLIGLAIGIYGLTQAIFQIPYGMLSDRIGRKPVIVMGLLIFAAGSVVAASADSLLVIVFGRALQGAGAIAATVMALTADLTREENRLSAMAIIGMSIGLAFTASLVLGPVLDQWIGVQGIFWLTALLSVMAIAGVIWVVPTPVKSTFHRDAMTAPQQLGVVLKNPQLLRLDMGVFLLHMMLTATFVVLPLELRDSVHLAAESHWTVYLPVMLLSLTIMVPFVVIAEKKRKMRQVFGAAILTLAMAECVFMLLSDSLAGMVFGLFVFFVAFNVLEATLPSLVAKMSQPDLKGTAMGAFSSSQFIGAFFGGMAGGWLYGAFGVTVVFGFCTILAMLWFSLAITMQNPRYLSSHLINVGEVDEVSARHLVTELTAVTGVAEAVVVVEDGIAYLKVDLHALDREALKRFSAIPA
ncbi:MAG: MFS transporter [Gammaproteobacteria bacterium]|nr:MFS transporter [Gammaproteobacteria bacterium]MDH5801095.1 MFS transporter [Gammaproteobacteria bacterium]